MVQTLRGNPSTSRPAFRRPGGLLQTPSADAGTSSSGERDKPIQAPTDAWPFFVVPAPLLPLRSRLATQAPTTSCHGLKQPPVPFNSMCSLWSSTYRCSGARDKPIYLFEGTCHTVVPGCSGGLHSSLTLVHVRERLPRVVCACSARRCATPCCVPAHKKLTLPQEFSQKRL